MTSLRVSRTHHPVTVLGHGTRIGVWVQGCTIGCDGCISRDTWPADGGTAVTVDTIVGWLDGLAGALDGLTVSGGEPFQQPDALAALLSAVRAWARSRSDPCALLGYAGEPADRHADRAGRRPVRCGERAAARRHAGRRRG